MFALLIKDPLPQEGESSPKTHRLLVFESERNAREEYNYVARASNPHYEEGARSPVVAFLELTSIVISK